MSKLKLFDKSKRRLNKKQAYHLGFDVIEHKLASEIKWILHKTHHVFGQAISSKLEGCHLKEMSPTLVPFTTIYQACGNEISNACRNHKICL